MAAGQGQMQGAVIWIVAWIVGKWIVTVKGLAGNREWLNSENVCSSGQGMSALGGVAAEDAGSRLILTTFSNSATSYVY